MVKALGFRAEPKAVYWAAIEGPELVVLEKGKLPAPVSYREPQALSWYRNQVRNLIAQHRPDSAGVKFPEPNARRGAVTSANRRVRIEGVILEACNGEGVPVLTASQVTMNKRLGAESVKAYIETGEFRGLDLSDLSKNLREAVVIAAAALESPDAEDRED